MIHHLILINDEQDIRLSQGKLISGNKRIAIDVLGSVQSFSTRARWTQSALESIASQCPVVLARWNSATKKWATCSVQPRCRYVNPNALYTICRLTERQATKLASASIFAKIQNQHTLLRAYDPSLSPTVHLHDNSFARILRAESRYARFFWARYFRAAASDLFAREKREAKAPLNIALNYGYGFLYHALEWQCMASGLDASIGLIHKNRKNRPSLICDLIEPLRVCVELTVIRYLDEIHEKKWMAVRFAEMLETRYVYGNHRFRLRTIIRLMVDSFVRALLQKAQYNPFRIHARDACI